MESYIEQVVVQRMNFESQAKRFILTILPLMLAILLIMTNVPPLYKVFVFAAVVGLVYLSYNMFMGFYIEWEYIFVTNEVSFAKISNKSKRKEMLTCQVNDTLVLAKSSDREHLGDLAKDAKKHVFLSNTGADYYVWVLKDKNGKKICVHFEPNEVMLNSIQTLARSKVFI